MIIKRRVTRQFVQLENALVRDKRLSLDEHGMLHYLLSLPDDWEVNRAQCAKYWSIGRDRCARIFRALRRTGWAQLERLQSEDGAFIGSRWIISDEPGEEASEESLVAEEAAEENDAAAETAAATATTETTVAPESQAPAALVLGGADHGSPTEPPTALPETAPLGALGPGHHDTPYPYHGSPGIRFTRHTGKASVLLRRPSSDEDLSETNTTGAGANASAEEDGEPPPSFGQVLKGWPPDHVVSPYACEKVFVKFGAQQKRDALHGMRPYLADCRAKGQTRLCDLKTFLDERRWERFISKTVTTTFYTVQRGSPQAVRWREYFERCEPQRLALFDAWMREGKGYMTRTEWPPALPEGARQDTAAEAMA